MSRQKSVELEVREVNRRLRELGSRLNATREAERSRIAREVHDDLGGSLTALKIDLVRRMERDGDADGQLARMIALVDDTVKAVRRICADLHPRILDDLGLLAAVEWQLERFGERTGLAWHLESAVEELVLERERALAVFRVFQEALTNVARHSQADSVWVSIRGDEQRLYLEVSDNGCGISAERMANTESFGIMGMQERIREVGGCVNFKTDTGQGTRVGVELPCIP